MIAHAQTFVNAANHLPVMTVHAKPPHWHHARRRWLRAMKAGARFTTIWDDQQRTYKMLNPTHRKLDDGLYEVRYQFEVAFNG